MTAERKVRFAINQLDRISRMCYVALHPEMERVQVVRILKRIHRRALALQMRLIDWRG